MGGREGKQGTYDRIQMNMYRKLRTCTIIESDQTKITEATKQKKISNFQTCTLAIRR